MPSPAARRADRGEEPVIVEELQGLITAIRQREVPVLLVEQDLAFCLALIGRSRIIEQGRIVHHDTRAALGATKDIREPCLTLG